MPVTADFQVVKQTLEVSLISVSLTACRYITGICMLIICFPCLAALTKC